MSWNYRVIKRNSDGNEWYGIYEVYYDDSGRPVACTETPINPFGETLDELATDLQHFTEAMAKPALDFDQFVGLPEKGL